MRGILLLFIMLVIIPASFFSPFIGLLSFTAAAYTRPHEWAYVETAQYSLAIAVATLLGYLIFELPRRSPRLMSNVLIVLLWVQLSISTVMARSTATAIPKYLEFSKILLIAVLTTAMVVSAERAWWFLMATLGSIGIIILKSFAAILVYRGEVKIFGVGGATGDNNDFALMLALTVPLMYYFAQAQTRWWLKAGFYALTLMTVITCLFTYSRGGLLGLSVSVFMLLLKSRHKIIGFVTAGIIVLTILAVLPQSLLNRFGSIKDASEKDASAQQRLRMWKISMDIIRDHPFVGVGIRNILVVHDRYADTPDDQKLVAHNSYFQMATDAGLPALGLFLGLIGLSWWRLWRTRRILRIHSPDSPLIKYAHGMEAGLAGYMTSAFFVSRQDLELLYAVFALATSFILMAREYEKEAEIRRLVERQAVAPVRDTETELDAA
ncbi:MAG TPA: putative O-glycosylation ligase, exosortase A system-associated [Blastocatellia bacterium]|nr:putative O-glycosylation ligase, exosortase A system-associated [Blastocatellia bacterium]